MTNIQRLQNFNVRNFDGYFLAELIDPENGNKIPFNGAWLGDHEMIAKGVQHIKNFPDDAAVLMIPEFMTKTYFHEAFVDLDSFKIKDLKVTHIFRGHTQEMFRRHPWHVVEPGMKVYVKAGFIDRHHIREGFIFQCNAMYGNDYLFHHPYWN
jgi:hypothetical protein